VRRIVNVSSAKLLPPPSLIRGIRGELLVAVVPHEDEVLLLIDIESVLTIDEKQELQEADLTQPAAS
jgi:chemotaxis signal transduction protein